MKKLIPAMTLAAMLGGLTLAAQAQITVWHDDFDQSAVGANSGDGTYGRIAYNFSGAGVGNPVVVITNGANTDTLTGDPSYTHSNYCAFIFTSMTNTLNFGWDINSIAATNNTNASLRAYTLSFDISVQGDGINNLGGFVGPIVYVFGQNTPGAYSSGEYYGDGAQTNINAGFFPAPGSGWTHIVMPLSNFGTANAGALNTTSAAFSFGIGAFMAGLTDTNQQEIDLANVEIMETNPPALPPPTMNLVPATPGLRVFAQDHTATYNQEGFSAEDVNQSWVGVATPANPVSYSITFADFNTVDNYTLYVQFVQNANPGDPFGVYNGQNALVWNITHVSTGFTTAINWKTNAPQSGQPNNVISLTTTSLDGLGGAWTLTFSNDLDGSITAPDGTSGSFSLPDETMAADFANPLVIDFGTAPNNVNGYGQWIDYAKIAITNVTDGNEYDDFTKDVALDTTLWNPGFSLNSSNVNNGGSVFLVSTNTPYWVNWTIPDEGFGLETKASLRGGTNTWFSPAYYGSAAGFANTPPQQMGTTLKWSLIPAACLPTADGTVSGPVSPTGFFQLAKPPPSQ